MPLFLQLSATCWLNLDHLVMVRGAAEQWTIWTSDDPQETALPPEEGEVLAWYLDRHAEKTAYAQTQGRSQETMP